MTTLGKISKSRRAEERRRHKKAMKQAKQEQYKSYSERGKAKRARNIELPKSPYKHPSRPCGNIGCQKCYPAYKTISIA